MVPGGKNCPIKLNACQVINMNKIDTVIFDLGGVLIDWNPKYLYQKIFDTKKEMDFFFSEICTHEWNVQQDAGRSLADATAILVDKHPEYQTEIEAYYGRWKEMLGGVLESTVEILEHLHQKKEHRILALTNWSAETFPYALENFKFLQLFEGILVSGVEKMKKPDPEIYQLILDRYQIDAPRSVFIDDSAQNVKGAEALNINGIHFQSSELLRKDLKKFGVL